MDSKRLPVGKDLSRGSRIGKGPLADHHQPVSQSGHILHGMADKDNGGVVGLPVGLNIGQNAGGARRVQPCGGLVQNEDLGLHGDDPGDGHPPLLAAGELKRGAARELRHADRQNAAAHAPAGQFRLRPAPCCGVRKQCPCTPFPQTADTPDIEKPTPPGSGWCGCSSLLLQISCPSKRI